MEKAGALPRPAAPAVLYAAGRQAGFMSTKPYKKSTRTICLV